MKKGIPGCPKFTYGDVVSFYLTLNEDKPPILCTGTVEIIDRYGTYFQKDHEPSYDVLVKNFNNSGEDIFCKHIVESEIIDV